MSAFEDCRDASPWADNSATDDEIDVAVYFFNAGRAYQRDVDAELIAYMYGNGKDMAKAIREQKID